MATLGDILSRDLSHYANSTNHESSNEETKQKVALKERVYSAWAYTENEDEKCEINQRIYERIKDKAKVEYVKAGYATQYYKVVDNPERLSTDELALICDSGNLCFGYRTENGMIVIYTD